MRSLHPASRPIERPHPPRPTTAPGKTLRKRVWVGGRSPLLRGELLVHVEGVVVHHKGHEGRQELGDELHLLAQEGRELDLPQPHLCPVLLLATILMPAPSPSQENCAKTPAKSHYHLGLLEDLAVDHIPGPLAQRQQPKQQEEVGAVLWGNRKSAPAPRASLPPTSSVAQQGPGAAASHTGSPAGVTLGCVCSPRRHGPGPTDPQPQAHPKGSPWPAQCTHPGQRLLTD